MAEGVVVSRADIEAAGERITGRVRITPVLRLETGVWDLDVKLTLKLELLQHSGSFKPRGAFNRVLTHDVPPAGVIAASGGNHGAAVAYVARALGYRAEIFVPESCPPIKVERLRRYGASVTAVGANYPAALTASAARAAETGALVVQAYDQPEVVAGQGTVGLEFDKQAELDTVLVAVGGGGLIGGIAAWFGDKTRVVGVEPERAPTLHQALEAGRPIDVEVGGIAADSLGAGRAGSLAFSIARRHVDRVILVSDEAIRRARRELWDEVRVLAELGGATALAPLLSGQYRPEPAERVGVVVCGGNTDVRSVL